MEVNKYESMLAQYDTNIKDEDVARAVSAIIKEKRQ